MSGDSISVYLKIFPCFIAPFFAGTLNIVFAVLVAAITTVVLLASFYDSDLHKAMVKKNDGAETGKRKKNRESSFNRAWA